MSPSFSPDGAAIAYASDREGRFQVYIRSLVAGGREFQLTQDEWQNVQPAWSPDGRYVAYYSIVQHGIFRILALGGSPSRVTNFGSQPAWSADSKWLAFRSQEAGTMGLTALIPDWPSTIWTVAAAGGYPPEPVPMKDKLPGQFTAPQFSADGHHMVFIYTTSAQSRELWSYGMDTRVAKRLECPLTLLTNPVCSPDGSIYVGGSSQSAECGIWRVPVDAQAQTSTGHPVPVTLTGSSVPSHMALSRDGRRLAYTAQSERSILRRLPLSRNTAVPAGPSIPFTTAYALRNTLPSFSPDGRKVAWYVNYQGSDGQIWVADFDGTNAAALVTGLDGPCAPRWMPDGRSIRCLAGRRTVTVWSVSLDDRLPRPVAEISLPGSWGELSPEGREIVYWRSRDGVANIWKTSLTGGQPVQLTFERESITFPFWSPDGQWIAANLTRGGDKHAVVFSSTGGPVKQLTNEPGLTLGTAWSPDSSKVLCAGFRQGVWNLYWVSRTTQEVKRLTNSRVPSTILRTPAWSPKGDQIVFEEMEVRGDIFALDLGGTSKH